MQLSIDVIRDHGLVRKERREREKKLEKNKKEDGRTYAIEIMISLFEEEKEKRYRRHIRFFKLPAPDAKGCQDFMVN